jgi:hypothetical protein
VKRLANPQGEVVFFGLIKNFSHTPIYKFTGLLIVSWSWRDLSGIFVLIMITMRVTGFHFIEAFGGL